MLLAVATFLAPSPAPSAPCLPCQLPGAAGLGAQNLDDRVQMALARSPATGAVVAVVHGDSLLLLQPFGTQDRERTRPMGLDHLFHLGSLGEFFLGAAAVRAALEGHVDLNAHVSAYAPDLPEGIGRATLAQLLTYTAGLDDSPLVGRQEGEEPQALPPERELELLSDRVLTAPPGMLRSSSRFSLLIAGHVLESALGRPLARIFDDLIGSPVGMASTVFSMEEATGLGTIPGYALSRSPDQPFRIVEPAVSDLLTPHLRAWSPVVDLARLLAAWLGGLGVDGARPGLAEAFHLTSLPVVTDPAVPVNPPAYGLGWSLGEFQGRREVRAVGGGSGHGALLRVVPEARLGVIVLTNGAGATLFGVSTFILESLLPVLASGPPAEPHLGGLPTTGVLPVPVVPDPEPVEEAGPRHAGTYRNGSEILVLAQAGDGLVADVGTGAPLEIRSQGDGVLTAHIADGRTAMRMRMVRDGEGRVYILLRGRAFRLEDPPADSG